MDLTLTINYQNIIILGIKNFDECFKTFFSQKDQEFWLFAGNGRNVNGDDDGYEL